MIKGSFVYYEEKREALKITMQSKPQRGSKVHFRYLFSLITL